MDIGNIVEVVKGVYIQEAQGDILANMIYNESLGREKKDFDKLMENANKAGDIFVYEKSLVLKRQHNDVVFLIAGDLDCNILTIQRGMDLLVDTMVEIMGESMCVKDIQRNYDIIILGIDKLFDHGIMIETDPISYQKSLEKNQFVAERKSHEQKLYTAINTAKSLKDFFFK